MAGRKSAVQSNGGGMAPGVWLRAMTAGAIALAALGAARAGFAAETEAQAAVRAHIECVWDNASKLDSDKLDAKQLAQKIEPLCHVAHETAMRASEPEQWAATPDDKKRELELEHTFAAVLYYRAGLQQQGSAQHR